MVLSQRHHVTWLIQQSAWAKMRVTNLALHKSRGVYSFQKVVTNYEITLQTQIQIKDDSFWEHGNWSHFWSNVEEWPDYWWAVGFGAVTLSERFTFLTVNRSLFQLLPGFLFKGVSGEILGGGSLLIKMLSLPKRCWEKKTLLKKKAFLLAMIMWAQLPWGLTTGCLKILSELQFL